MIETLAEVVYRDYLDRMVNLGFARVNPDWRWWKPWVEKYQVRFDAKGEFNGANVQIR